MRLTAEPERTCVGCARKYPQGELLRVSSLGGAEPVLDGARRGAGRGAYLCRSVECLRRAMARQGLQRTLRLKAPLPAELLDCLRLAIARELE